jgi:hypothetical protein
VTYINNKLRKIKEKIQVNGLPKIKITNLSWSPNEKKIAFKYFKTGVSLWVVDVASAKLNN